MTFEVARPNSPTPDEEVLAALPNSPTPDEELLDASASMAMPIHIARPTDFKCMVLPPILAKVSAFTLVGMRMRWIGK